MAQLNFCVGDVLGNAEKMIETIQWAKKNTADMVVFSELALTGYPPEDLLLSDDLFEKIEIALTKIKACSQDCYVVLGYPEKTNDERFNVASVLFENKIIAHYRKHFLPNYGVFDEVRYFTPGHQGCVFECRGIKTGLVICEDVWYPSPIAQAVSQGAQWVITINASPYDDKKFSARTHVLKQRAQENKVPLLYVNQVGGQDDLIFDGRSLLMDAQGQIQVCAAFCKEDRVLVEIHQNKKNLLVSSSEIMPPPLTDCAQLYEALCLSLRDYVTKNKFNRVFLGLSGGVDSALVLTLAADALGADKVTALIMPSRYTASMSVEDAYALANALEVKTEEVTIESVFDSLLKTLTPLFEGRASDVTEKNIQARIRAILLMAMANKFNGLVLTTSNKSEVAVGYSTLYGDMAGGFDVLKDVYKTEVYRLVRYRNEQAAIIPERILTRPPTAELSLGEVDQDDLPPYEVLDKVLHALIEKNLPEQAVAKLGYEPVMVERINALIKKNEYKRQQAPIGPRVTVRSFGKDWRFPVTKR
ncbi:MAG: NAD+ synthase [Gammaproteobacteria bacterium]|nr:NAD+ synthase [Gammaproteobacteria bacterium]